MRLLLVEDDDAIAAALVVGLTRERFEVVRASTVAAALAAPPADLVLLDLALPDGEGREVIAGLRNATPVPIIVVTAHGHESDRVTHLNLGADDYVIKPFSFRELVARIWAVARRSGRPAPLVGPQLVGDLVIDRRIHQVSVGGVTVACTPKEYMILDLLAEDPGAVVTRQDLLDRVWGPHWYGSTKMIDVHVASLRKKLSGGTRIETVRGVGFRLSEAGSG